MKKFLIACLMVCVGFSVSAQDSKISASAAAVLSTAKWYGQNSLRLEVAGKVIWIDPAYGTISEKADIILVTHSHADHFAASRIKKLSGPKTTTLVGFADFSLTRIQVGEKKTIGEITIEAVAMYDLFDVPHHEKSIGFTGFLISARGLTIYIAGDTGRIPELKNLRADIAFLPLGQQYSMKSVEEAVDAALDIGAKYVVPVHYGLYEGTEADADTFVQLAIAKGLQAKRLVKSE